MNNVSILLTASKLQRNNNFHKIKLILLHKLHL